MFVTSFLFSRQNFILNLSFHHSFSVLFCQKKLKTSKIHGDLFSLLSHPRPFHLLLLLLRRYPPQRSGDSLRFRPPLDGLNPSTRLPNPISLSVPNFNCFRSFKRRFHSIGPTLSESTPIPNFTASPFH